MNRLILPNSSLKCSFLKYPPAYIHSESLELCGYSHRDQSLVSFWPLDLQKAFQVSKSFNSEENIHLYLNYPSVGNCTIYYEAVCLSNTSTNTSFHYCIFYLKHNWDFKIHIWILTYHNCMVTCTYYIFFSTYNIVINHISVKSFFKAKVKCNRECKYPSQSYSLKSKFSIIV